MLGYAAVHESMMYGHGLLTDLLPPLRAFGSDVFGKDTVLTNQPREDGTNHCAAKPNQGSNDFFAHHRCSLNGEFRGAGEWTVPDER